MDLSFYFLFYLCSLSFLLYKCCINVGLFYSCFNDTHSSHCASRRVSHRVLSVSLANDPKSILRYLVFFASTCRVPLVSVATRQPTSRSRLVKKKHVVYSCNFSNRSHAIDFKRRRCSAPRGGENQIGNPSVVFFASRSESNVSHARVNPGRSRRERERKILSLRREIAKVSTARAVAPR